MTRVPFLDLRQAHRAIRLDLDEAHRRVLDSGWFVRGPELEAFESEYAQFSGTRFAIGCSNGLDALRLSLEAMKIGPGDEVLVPANTFIASVLAVLQVGAVPVLVDPHPQTGLLDGATLDAHCSPHTRVVMPVHLFGHPVDMDAVMDLAQKRGLHVIEDNAQAHGARWNGRQTGSWGNANATSFYPGKNLGALGDGGAVTTDSEHVAAAIRVKGNYGSGEKYVHHEVGYNMRLDELQAAFLRVKLRHLERWNAERRVIARAYDEAFSQKTGIEGLPERPGAMPVHHLYVVRVADRPRFQQHLSEAGIQHLVHYPIPPHLQGACAQLNHAAGDFPVAERWAGELVSLPIWPGMDSGQIEAVIQVVTGYAP
jgi:dTDP-4-amino-4,6-dideoxygalactose transaminase